MSHVLKNNCRYIENYKSNTHLAVCHEPLHSRLPPRLPPPVVPVLEHFTGRRIERPVAALAAAAAPRAADLVLRFRRLVPRHLHEALVQTEVVPDAVLPALPVLAVVRESIHDVAVDAREGEPSPRRRGDRHRDEGDVRVRGFLVAFRCAAGGKDHAGLAMLVQLATAELLFPVKRA